LFSIKTSMSMESPHKDSKPDCVCVYMFFYPVGDLNLNAHRLMGTCATVGPKLRFTLINHTDFLFIFLNVKMENVSCDG